MKAPYRIESDASPGLFLRAVDAKDAEHLRKWKNANSKSFFFQTEITPEAQQQWFAGFLEREDDWMFMVELDGSPIGCMGFRRRPFGVDVYNIMRNPDDAGRGSIGVALKTMCKYIVENESGRVVARVLTTNPAVAWYERIGFSISSVEEGYFMMVLDTQTLEDIGSLTVIHTPADLRTLPLHTLDSND